MKKKICQGYCKCPDCHVLADKFGNIPIRPNKIILDACCGGRMFWFNKRHPNVLYIDNRVLNKGKAGKSNPNFEIKSDVIMDFRKMDFRDKSFKLVVFDPPHKFESGCLFNIEYGSLSKETWKEDILQGFNECWRVLEDYGVLIFKWAENNVKIGEVIKLLPQTPLFGQTAGSKSKTHWLCFMKIL